MANESIDTPLGTELSGGEATSVAEAPTPIDIGDDTLVRIPGQEEPVKYGELYKRQQADYTRKTQQHAKAVADWQRQRGQQEAQARSREAELKQLTATLLQHQQAGNPNSPQNAMAQLAARPYVDGRTFAQTLQEIRDKGFGTVAQAIKERDSRVEAMGAQINELSKLVQRVQGTHVNSQFDGKITKWLGDLGLPPEAADFAKEVYLAYEGDDLDEQFPDILKNRWDQISNLQNKARQAKVQAAKSSIFPTQGGQGVAGETLGLKGNESAKQTADKLWDLMQADDSQRT